MEVSITQFRRELFSLVNQAMEGTELWVKHKGQRFRILPDSLPDNPPLNKLSRITPMKIINTGAVSLDDRALMAEMTRSWEEDWERDFGPAPEIKSSSDRNEIKR